MAGRRACDGAPPVSATCAGLASQTVKARQPKPDHALVTSRQKRALRSELSNLVVSLAVAGGGIAGLLWAMDRPTATPPASCSSPGAAADAIGECVGDSLLLSVLPYVLGVGVGGLMSGLLAALLLRAVFRSRRGDRGEGAARRRWITARYSGRCFGCRGSIAPGDRIRHAPGRTLCRACGMT